MPTKTIYIKDEDVDVWKKAKQVIGDSLSSYITEYLKETVNNYRSPANEFQRIVLSFNENGLPKRKAFFGKWVVPLDDPWDGSDSPYEQDNYALAISQKNNIVIFNWGDNDLFDSGPWGVLNYFASFEEAAAEKSIPTDFISYALNKIGVEIEELDI